MIPCFVPTHLFIDRSILCCCSILDLNIDPGHPTKSPGPFQFLPREYLSGYDQPTSFEFPPYFPTLILSTKLRSLGERTLVLELGHQPYLCPIRNLPTAMGSKIPKGHSVALQPSQKGADSCVFRRRCREVSPSMGGRNITHTPPHFPIPILRRPRCIPIKYQSHDF